MGWRLEAALRGQRRSLPLELEPFQRRSPAATGNPLAARWKPALLPPESKGSSACREVRILPLMQHVWHAVQRTVLGEKGKDGFCLHSEKRPFDNCVSRASEPLHTWGLSPSHHRSSQVKGGTSNNPGAQNLQPRTRACPEGSFQHQGLCFQHHPTGSLGLGESPRVRISDKFPGDAVGLGTLLCVSRDRSVEFWVPR